MGVQEEIFRLRYQAIGKQEVAQADKGLQALAVRVANLKREFDAGRISLQRYEAALLSAQRRAETFQAARSKWSQQSGDDRRGARARTGFALANIAQDLPYGGTAVINNLIQPQIWKDLAASIGGGRLALAGFGTTAVAVGAGLVTINAGLKKANLEWSDFGSVVGNTAPVRGAKEAINDLGETIRHTIGQDNLDTFDTWLGDLAEYAVGWRTATKAVKEHKDALSAQAKEDAAHATIAEQFGGGAARKAAEPFMRAMEAAGGGKGAGGVLDQIKDRAMRNGLPMAGDLEQRLRDGDPAAMREVMGLARKAGINTAGMEDAYRASTLVGPPAPSVEDDAMMRAQREQNDALNRELNQAGRDNVAGMEADALGQVDNLDWRVRQGIESRLGQGMSRQDAEAQVKSGLADELGGDLLPDAAGRVASDAVDAIVARMRQEAAAMNADTPGGLMGALGDNQLDMMRLNMRSMSEGPRTVSTESFARMAESKQEPLQKKMVEDLGKIRDYSRLNAERLKILEKLAVLE